MLIKASLIYSISEQLNVAVNRLSAFEIKSLESQVLVNSQFKEITERLSKVEDSGTTGSSVDHHPHTKYFAKIPEVNGVPVDIGKSYSYDDFETVFGVVPLHHVEFSQEALDLLGNSSVTHDRYYQKHYDFIMDHLPQCTKFLEEGSHAKEEMEKYEVKWASAETGFGVFAKQEISPNEIVGVYTGVLSADIVDTDYTWVYLTKKVNDEKVDIGIDGLAKGNYLRFINHIGDDANVTVEIIKLAMVYANQ